MIDDKLLFYLDHITTIKVFNPETISTKEKQKRDGRTDRQSKNVAE